MFTIRHRREDRQPLPDERLAALLDAAAAPSEPGPAPGETEALAAFRAAHQTTRSGRSRMLSPTPLKTAAAAVLGTGVLLTGGVAAAQAGSLPGAAQSVAQTALATLGVSVPGPDEHSAGHADERGASTDAPRGSDAARTAAGAGEDDAAEPTGKGAEISELARTTDAEGVEKGATISDVASGGASQAGEHGQAGQHGQAEAPGQPPASGADHAPITTPNTGGTDRPDPPAAGGSLAAGDAGQDDAPATAPNSGGTGTADTASGGRAEAGTGTADTASGGRSAGGSDNSP
jgi:hypothetical protein